MAETRNLAGTATQRPFAHHIGDAAQRRYWEHTIRDEDDFARHADYIHFNPVKHGHVERVRDWPSSSFHRMVRLGIYPADWAGGPVDHEDGFGERRDAKP